MTDIQPGYKQTEVGVIPDDWNAASLGNLTVLMTNGFVGIATQHYAENENGVLYIQGYNVEENAFNFHGIKYVTHEFHKAHAKSCLRSGDLLTVQTGDVGLTSVVTDDLAGSNCHALIISRYDKRSVSPGFISYYLNSSPGRSRLRLIETGTTMKHLNVGDMLEFLVPMPPTKAEQQAIAEALSDADALIELLEQLITKKRHIKQGAMQQLLTGKKRLPGFSGEWVVKRLGEIGNCLRGVTYKGDSDLSPYDTIHTMRLLRSNNVQNASVVITDIQFVNDARVSENQLLRNDDILICMANGSKALVGKAGLFKLNDGYEYTFGAFMGCFRSNLLETNPTFVFFLFQTGRYRNYIINLLAGSSINNLNPSSIESLEFPIPPFPEQTAIATILSDMDTEITTLETQLAKTRALKQGMMHNLLTGSIRLV